jgi:hypothetical protein
VAARRGAQQGRDRNILVFSRALSLILAKLVSGTATNRYLRLGNVSDREHTIL